MRKTIITSLCAFFCIAMVAEAQENIWNYPVRLSIDRPVVHIGVGKTSALKVLPFPAESNTDVVWKSLDETVVSVSPEGVLEGKSEGMADVIATSVLSPLISDTCRVQVSVREDGYKSVTGFSHDKGDAGLNFGPVGVNKGMKFGVKFMPGDATDQTWSWVSADSTIAKVEFKDNVWKVLLYAGGETTIRLISNDGGYEDVLNVKCLNVNKVPRLETLELGQEEYSLVKGRTMHLRVRPVPAGAFKDVVWKSEQEQVAAVNADGVVAGVGVGSSKITATSVYDDKIVAECVVNVFEPVCAESVVISAQDTELTLGEVSRLGYTMFPDNVETPLVSWSSSDPETVSVNPETGVVRALKEGTALIKAVSYDGKASDEVELTVKRTFNMSSISVPEVLKAGEILHLGLLNPLGEIRDIKWYCNERLLPDGELVLSRGRHIVKCHVGYAGGESEVLVKYFNVR